MGGEHTRPGSVTLGKEETEGDLLYPGHAGPVGEVVNRPQVALTEDEAQNLLHPGGTCRTGVKGGAGVEVWLLLPKTFFPLGVTDLLCASLILARILKPAWSSLAVLRAQTTGPKSGPAE